MMKTRFSRALPLLIGAGLLFAGHVYAQDGKETAAQAAKREADARAAATSVQNVDVNQERKPSYYVNDQGTTVTEYRDRGKPTEIDVHSRFGTNYQLTTPPDNAPRARDNTSQNDRLPSVGLKF
ncbi:MULTISPECIES: hypothetical protein [Pandoraea]|uniref:DUF2782 domain-containing protein n=3 Tax=Pandoraea TaxID=93217 RepID=A0ABY5QC69_9BURK|nr:MULTISPECIES: hypothetical protein [Pandoraea]UVA77898.1 hypothetical protein NTU39_17615 [Pandoraea commovens]